MTITKRSTIGDVAAIVSQTLTNAGISVVLTGGACATLYSEGAYQSHDLDFILQARTQRRALDDAMSSIGFRRETDRYVHPATELFVEFPKGPLAIGDDLDVRPVRLDLGAGSTLALSATDACRDRLAAFYHWSDRQSLDVAVQIALRHRVRMTAIASWSEREGATEKFGEFQQAIRRARSQSTRARGARPPGRRGR